MDTMMTAVAEACVAARTALTWVAPHGPLTTWIAPYGHSECGAALALAERSVRDDDVTLDELHAAERATAAARGAIDDGCGGGYEDVVAMLATNAIQYAVRAAIAAAHAQEAERRLKAGSANPMRIAFARRALKDAPTAIKHAVAEAKVAAEEIERMMTRLGRIK